MPLRLPILPRGLASFDEQLLKLHGVLGVVIKSLIPVLSVDFPELQRNSGDCKGDRSCLEAQVLDLGVQRSWEYVDESGYGDSGYGEPTELWI